MNCQKINIKAFAFGVLILLTVQLFGQTENIGVTYKYNGLHWIEFVSKMEVEYNVRFYYNPDSIPDFEIKVSREDITLREFLTEMLAAYNIYPSFDGSGNIFLTSGSAITVSLSPGFFSPIVYVSPESDTTLKGANKKIDFLTTKKEYVVRAITLGNKKTGLNEVKSTITGFVRNIRDSVPLINATLYLEELQKGTTTDESGKYIINLPKGKYTLVVSSLESKTEKFKLTILSGDRFDIYLEPNLFLLDEFVVSTEKDHNVKGSQMGFEKLVVKKINEIPVVLGEKDIIKVALLLPGVQTIGEGSTGFNVRGSPADQNMFYINSIPIYNSSHLFGFFSAFNSDAVSEFALLKSNIPVRYGGRLSSIFDVTAKQGNMSKFNATGGISPVTARLVAEGPIVANKVSYLVGIRSTYSDWLFRYIKDPQLKESSAYFGDAVINFTMKLNPSNELRLFTYYSYDEADIASLTSNRYQNIGGSLAWNHLMKEKHSLAITFAAGKYSFLDENMEYDLYAYKQSYDLSHNELKAEVILRPVKQHAISIGINSILYQLEPGDVLPLDENSLVEPESFEPEKGLESGIYIGDQWTLTPKLEINAGLRYNLYAYLGPKTIYTYQDGQPRSAESILDTLTYSDNAVIKTYDGIDYRIAARYLIHENLSLKAGYNKLHQYIFMLSNTIAISPTDEWKLCDYNIKPMTGDQFSLGLYSNFMGGAYEVSVEGYYKDVKNLVEYKDGAEMVANQFPETDIVQGNLNAYGIEFMVKKPLGTLNGWINYTYSRAKVLVDNPTTGEQNNFGMTYPANYDKPHAFNLVANYRLSKRISFSGNLVYSTGRPITYPTAIYYQDGNKIIHYSVRNEYRLPDYFRIDISVNLEGNLKLKKFAHGSWNFSVYNLTGRKNAYSVYFKSEEGKITGYRLSIFGSQIYSISYNFKLGNYEN
jgi:hypothetical protein